MTARFGSESTPFELQSQDRPLKCNRALQQPPAATLIFRYDQYSAHISNKIEGERRQRIQNVRKSQTVPPLEHYTDDILKQQFFSFYGDCMESHPKFKLLFVTFKQERLDQIREWIQEEEAEIAIIPQVVELSAEGASSGRDDTILKPKEFQTSFSNDTTTLLPIDPFLLPRKKRVVAELRQIQPLDGLTEFDPDINLPKIIVSPSCQKNLGAQLAQQIVTIVRKYPSGISSQVLHKELKKLYVNEKIPCSNFDQLLKKYGPQLCFVQELCSEHPQELLYYPKCLAGLIASPMEMFENIWHSMRILVNEKMGAVRLSKLLPLCCSVFGWKSVDVSLWGFPDDARFVQFLIGYFGHNLRLINRKFGINKKGNGREDILYLVAVANEGQERKLNSCIGPKKIMETKKIEKFSNAPPPHHPRPSSTINTAFPTLSEGQALTSNKQKAGRGGGPRNVSHQPKSWNKLF